VQRLQSWRAAFQELLQQWILSTLTAAPQSGEFRQVVLAEKNDLRNESRAGM
jgi:hypothetical protein